MKHKIMPLFMAAILAASIMGCKREASPTFSAETGFRQTQPSLAPRPEKTEEIPEPIANPESGDALFSACDLEGTVWEASDTGCTILPVQSDDNVMEAPAPGTEAEAQWKKVQVTYSEGCTFQYAYLNQRAGTVRYAEARQEDVKAQSSVVLYGQYDGTQGFRADRVFLYQFV